jgi:hypothetical protein
MPQSNQFLTSNQNGSDALTGDRLARWAAVVASGEAAFPTGLCDEDQERLLSEVRRQRRSRLIQFVARVIAQDILRSRDQQHGGH